MKKFLLSALVVSVLTSFAQQDVYLRFMHQWDGQVYAHNTPAVLSNGETIELSRVEYYVSSIKLYHDGGQMTDLSNIYILANAVTGTMEQSLGNLNITTLDSVSFGIGVDAGSNHADPALYDMSHPLAPKSPSMHWGWAAGYRFACVEGEAGTSSSDIVEIHALGDANYFTQTIATSGTVVGGNLIIQLDAEYTKLFSGITLTGGVILHGETGPAVTLLSNFRDSVFTVSAQNVSGIGVEEYPVSNINMYPNPASTSGAELTFETPITGTITVLDVAGRPVNRVELNDATSAHINVPHTGVYLVEVASGGERTTLRLVVNR